MFSEPIFYSLTELQQNSTLVPGRGYVPARPLNAYSLLWRIRAAWQVLLGRGGVVFWR